MIYWHLVDGLKMIWKLNKHFFYSEIVFWESQQGNKKLCVNFLCRVGEGLEVCWGFQLLDFLIKDDSMKIKY
jgi:hypothetical protein